MIRFGVSLEKELLELFDNHIKRQRSGNRSQAIANLIREELIRQEWLEDKIIAGVITLVYNHHQRELVTRLTDIQHDYHQAIITSQHIHLDHDNCFEIIVVTGKATLLQELTELLKASKGVKHASLTLATTGKDIV